MRKFKIIGISLLLVMIFASCAANKYQVMYGIANWTYTNHVTLQSQYNAANPETQAWLRENVNPYMNIMQQVVIGIEAIDSGDNAKASLCATEIVRIAVGVKYDVTRIIAAIQARDYDTLFAESLALKSFIIQKLNERR